MINSALKKIKEGIPIILVDEEDRENEGDAVIAAEMASVNNIVFFMRHVRGLMCIPTDGAILDRLEIPMMVTHSTDRLATPFTVSVDAANGISTGMSVYDRLKTISTILDPKSKPMDLARPGHLFPLRPRPNLLKDRAGHTESSIQLLKMAGLQPVSIICEIINDDGTMARGDSLSAFGKKFNLEVVSIAEIKKEIGL